ncbi:MAG: hypothetical protein M3321_07425, partial [Actinomycetota bacterium]|nr:hypothetical protein [Actinomycetota bacterium]
MSESIWKKEISFRRKPKAASPAAPAAPASVPATEQKQSIWKREISLGRKRARDDAPAPAAVSIAPEPETQSASEPRPVHEPETPRQLPHAAGDYEWRPEAVPAQPPVVEPVPAPILQNVVPLSAAPPLPPPAPAPAQAERKPSFLKRDLGRKRKAAEEDAPTVETTPRPEKAP